jgi:hypothetical protein
MKKNFLWGLSFLLCSASPGQASFSAVDEIVSQWNGGNKPGKPPQKIFPTQNTGQNTGTDQGKVAFVQIGINYTGTRSALKGCVNDLDNLYTQQLSGRVDQGKLNLKNSVFYVLTDGKAYTGKIQSLLQDKATGYAKSEDDRQEIRARSFFSLETGKSIKGSPHGVFGWPTRQNIETVLEHVMARDDITSLVLQYSGHGSHTWSSGDAEEETGRDQTIVPADFENKGMILDDWLTKTVVDPLPWKKKIRGVFALMDCCHSGTIFDLCYRAECVGSKVTCKHVRHRDYPVTPNVMVLSGCKDTETSEDAFLEGRYQGALTYGFLEACQAMQKNFEWPVPELMSHVYGAVKGFSQRPVWSTGFCLNSGCQNTTPESSFMIQARINQILFPVFQ